MQQCDLGFKCQSFGFLTHNFFRDCIDLLDCYYHIRQNVTGFWFFFIGYFSILSLSIVNSIYSKGGLYSIESVLVVGNVLNLSVKTDLELTSVIT